MTAAPQFEQRTPSLESVDSVGKASKANDQQVEQHVPKPPSLKRNPITGELDETVVLGKSGSADRARACAPRQSAG